MKFLNSLRNQWLVSRAWMFTTLVLGGMLIYLLSSYVTLSQSMPVRLVPHHFHLADGPMEVGVDSVTTDATYLASIAEADVQFHGTWHPENVERQYARLINRMTPALRSRVGTDLLARIPDLADSERSQVLFLEGAEVSNDGDVVRVYGQLQAWYGSEPVEDQPVTYRLRYAFSNGVPYIASFVEEE